MVELEEPRVERDALVRQRLARAVLEVADERGAERRGAHAELVRAAGARSELAERPAMALREDAPGRDRVTRYLARSGERAHTVPLLVLHEPLLEHALARLRTSLAHAPVDL